MFNNILLNNNILSNVYHKTSRGYEALSYHTISVFQIKKGNRLIKSIINEGIPSAMGKIGSVELLVLKHYLNTKDVSDRELFWEKHEKELYVNADVFPLKRTVLDRWATIFLDEIKLMKIVKYGSIQANQN